MKATIRIQESFDKCEDGVWLPTWSTPSGVKGVCHQHVSLSTRRWNGIKTRTKDGGTFQKSNPTYIGVVNGFADFNHFVEWSRLQVGYLDREIIGGKAHNWSLDKDIIGNGCSYDENSCIFVPKRINNFFVSQARRRGEYPIGVSLKDGSNAILKYVCYVNIQDGGVYTKRYETVEEAHRGWQMKKAEIGLELAKEFQLTHPKLYSGLVAYSERLLDDRANFRVTEFY